MLKMKPKQFTDEQLQAVKVESAQQSTERVTPKSTDPEHFPVFDIPVNDKVKIYVPNHVVITPEGEELRMDKPLLHTVIDGKRFNKIRCVRGLSESAGYSGNCPLCDGENEPWDLANEEIKEQCRARGLDPVADAENETVKSIKREHYSKRVIKSPEQYYTFPIVVLETEPGNIKKFVYDENNNLKYKVYWYTISKSAYEKKWLKTLEGMEDEPTHPGGYTFILNYTYDSKSGDYNKRDSARELQVVNCKINGFEELAPQFDKLTDEWDPVKAMSTIYDNMYYEENNIEAEVDRVLTPTREKIALYQSISSGAKADTSNTGFNLEKPADGGALPSGDDGIGGLPMAGEVDE